MSYTMSHFEEYIQLEKNNPLHPKLNTIYNRFPPDIQSLQSLIFYGPKGSGKYTQMLKSILKYSPSHLKYERRITNIVGNSTYTLKISDIHFEVDMELLGCNAKVLWGEIYLHIMEILQTRPCRTGIIVCKNFHDIHNELLEVFYSYMQTLTYTEVNIKYILLTEHISFIPDKIVDRCRVLSIPRPSKSHNTIVRRNTSVTSDITTLKYCNHVPYPIMHPYTTLCDQILECIRTPQYSEIRDRMYDILIYNLNVMDCIWYILSNVIVQKIVTPHQITPMLIQTYRFLYYYNNNYRPIYHLERFIFHIINTIHEDTKGV